MDLRTVCVYESCELGKKAYAKKVEVGKWFCFRGSSGGSIIYGKVVTIRKGGYVEIEKSFELPARRPYAEQKWFDRLPMATE